MMHGAYNVKMAVICKWTFQNLILEVESCYESDGHWTGKQIQIEPKFHWLFHKSTTHYPINAKILHGIVCLLLAVKIPWMVY